MKMKFISKIFNVSLWLFAFLICSCASKPSNENQTIRPKTGNPIAIQVIDETVEQELIDENADIDFSDVEFVDEIADETDFLDEKKIEITYVEPQNITIELNNYFPRINVIKNVSEGFAWNYQNITSLNSVFEDGELPKAGDTVTITFEGTSDTDINSPVYVTLIENRSGKNWIDLVSSNDDEKYSIFAENIKANEPFSATATFYLTKSCQKNISLHLIYPVKNDNDRSTWTSAKKLEK